jgi:transposase
MWENMKMTKVVEAVKSKEMGLKEASKVFEVSRSTPNDKVNSIETDIEKLTDIRLGKKPKLPYKFEEEIVS